MKDEDLLRAIGFIGEELLEEALVPQAKEQYAKRKKRYSKRKKRYSKKVHSWQKWGLAAAAVLVIAAGIGMNRTPERLELPKLELSEDSPAGGGGGVMLYDIGELNTGNPWTEQVQLETLPVYKNTAYSDGAGMPVYHGNEEELLTIARQTAAELGMESGEHEYSRDNEGNAYQVTLAAGLASITVLGNHQIRISYLDGAGPKPGEDVSTYLAEQYQDLLLFREPKIMPQYEYLISGDLNVRYQAYDGSGSLEEQILNYNFSQVTFYLNENHRLAVIWKEHILDAAQKLGDYPLISEAKARKQLLKGNYYYSTGWEETPDKKHIAKVELTYLSINLEQIFMPYYKYWVEMPEEQMENGLKLYQCYYVPAVQAQYLSNQE